ncbi:MAG: bifunctional aspartate kinase/homoserine dehydrogenase I [Flavobacteriales bacterium]|nr:bifunctional aspartate kinase/homoserine dehydrogenase I [Flavobacteriales bacterium]|tara:strand:+ start:1593 stop:4025 length:2433 start_codon:yes stop_codon:yes gene_type:complete
MKVLKFGGTSVGTANSIKRVQEIIAHEAKEDRVIVVVSAMTQVTNKLLAASELAANGDESYKEITKEIENKHFDAIRELVAIDQQSGVIANIKVLLNQLEDILNGVFLVRELSPKTSDYVVSFGESLSSIILSKSIGAELVDSKSLIRTNTQHGGAAVLHETTYENIKDFFQSNDANVFVAPGFVASTEEGITSTLGRGGSDFSAALYAAGSDAAELQIWTDVSGMYTADPRKVKSAFPVKYASYKEAMELSHFGAKVIYPPTILPVYKKGIPLKIKNTFAPEDQGTLITASADEGMPIKGISSIDKIALASLSGSGMIGIPGISARLFGALSRAKVNVILITQASSEHSISFAISPEDINLAVEAVKEEFVFEIQTGKINSPRVETGLSVIALVGEKMSGQVNVSGKMFNTLGSNGVNMRAIAQGSSERNISAVIEEKDVKKALNVLHENHFEGSNKVLNLFVVGVGNVGGTLVDQIKQQQKVLQKNSNIVVRVTGLANSKKMLLNSEGIDLNGWQDQVESSSVIFHKDELIEQIAELNLRNSVFVDCTANYEIASVYKKALENNINVVTANKIACSSDYELYQELKAICLKNNVKFLYETNVGAGLPVIGTINDLVHSGDRIQKIEATVSGSLNFIFNTYDGNNTFHDVVSQAKSEGYTEPDPRIDLSGVDVKRKILILIREAGIKMEFDDIEVKDILPKACFEVDSVEDFFNLLKNDEPTFQEMVGNAQSEGRKLRVIAKYEDGKATVELQAVDSTHPFYNLQGTDNTVALYTDRYVSQPMVIQGAGAGAGVTAAGVFADIVRIANY